MLEEQLKTRSIPHPIRAVGAWLLAGAAALAAPVDLSPPKVAVGSADENGYLLLIQPLGSVDLGEGAELPLRLDFSSARASQESDFGWPGWSCGVLESSARFTGGLEYIRVHLLCAKELLLKRDGKAAATYTSPDKQWKAKAGAGKIRVWRDDGWELNFTNGNVVSLRTDSSREFAWNRDEAGRLISITENGVTPKPLQVEWLEDTIRSITTANDRYDFTFRDGRLAGIDWEQKTDLPKSLRISQDGDSLAVERGRDPSRKFEWDPDSGLLTADDLAKYWIEHSAAKEGSDSTKPMKTIVMERSDGVVLRFRADRNAGVSRKTPPSGKGELVFRRFTREGPMVNVLGRIDYIPEDAEEPIILLQNFFGRGGKVVKRMWRGDPRKFSGFSEGRIEEVFLAMPQTVYPVRDLDAVVGEDLHKIEYSYGSYRKLMKVTVDGETVLERAFDDRGRMTLERIPGRFTERQVYREDGSRETSVEREGAGHFADHGAEIGSVVAANGRKTHKRLGDGRIQHFKYDVGGRVIETVTVAPDGETTISVKRFIYNDDGLRRYEFIDDRLVGKQTHLDVSLDSQGVVVARRSLERAPDWAAGRNTDSNSD